MAIRPVAYLERVPDLHRVSLNPTRSAVHFEHMWVPKLHRKLTRTFWSTSGTAQDFRTDLAHDLPPPETPEPRPALSPSLFAAPYGRQAESEGSLLKIAKQPPWSFLSRTRLALRGSLIWLFGDAIFDVTDIILGIGSPHRAEGPSSPHPWRG